MINLIQVPELPNLSLLFSLPLPLQFELVCSYSWLNQLSSTGFMLGMLLGSVLSGILSDRFVDVSIKLPSHVQNYMAKGNFLPRQTYMYHLWHYTVTLRCAYMKVMFRVEMVNNK